MLFRSVWNGNSFIYNGNVFPVWTDGSFSGGIERNGTLSRSDDPFGNRNSRDKNCLDFLDLSCTSFIGYFIYFLSCILDHYDHYAGNLLLFREKKSTPGYAAAGIE